MRKLPGSGHVGEHHISRIGKQRLSKLIPFPRIPRNVKFHHKNPRSRTLTAAHKTILNTEAESLRNRTSAPTPLCPPVRLISAAE